jgi:hypothetical protein
METSGYRRIKNQRLFQCPTIRLGCFFISALAGPTRRNILEMLVGKDELSASEISDKSSYDDQNQEQINPILIPIIP